MNKHTSVNSDVLKAAFIDGTWKDGSAGKFEVRNPHNGELLHEVGYAGPDDVEAAIASARKAQPAWAALSTIERAQIMRRVHQIFLERAEPIARMITAEIGKTINDAREEVVRIFRSVLGEVGRGNPAPPRPELSLHPGAHAQQALWS
ncbi:aldehyde dehydrogenase family protein [uncultured Roseibium sp.]|uniref:aldehyde dehydrogenase family protein n=1 Tax=uncultured Roseibium sp. TaxID=1936171 RepID=UPI0032163A48